MLGVTSGANVPDAAGSRDRRSVFGTSAAPPAEAPRPPQTAKVWRAVSACHARAACHLALARQGSQPLARPAARRGGAAVDQRAYPVRQERRAARSARAVRLQRQSAIGSLCTAHWSTAAHTALAAKYETVVVDGIRIKRKVTEQQPLPVRPRARARLRSLPPSPVSERAPQSPPPPPPPPPSWLAGPPSGALPPFPPQCTAELHGELAEVGAVPERTRLAELLQRLVLSTYNRWADWAVGAAPGGAAAAADHVLMAVADTLAQWEASASAAVAAGQLQLQPDVAAAAAAGAAARLVAQRDALVAEEAAWKALEAASVAEAERASVAAATGAAPPGADGAQPPAPQAAAAAVAAAVADVAAGSCAGELRAAVAAAELKLELHADGVAALVTGADMLASRAEAAAAALASALAEAEMRQLAAPPAGAASPRQLLRLLAA